MDEPEATQDHKTLNALNEQIAAEQTRIAELEHRIRVIDVEVASWKSLPPPKTAVLPEGFKHGAFAFMLGFAASALLGKLIAAVIGR